MRAIIASMVVGLGMGMQVRADIPDDPAIATVESFQDALLASMHREPAKLADSIHSQFNVSVMSAYIAGPAWNSASSSERTLVGAAFTRYLVARFAHEFDSYDGEQFQIDAPVQSRGPDKMIQTRVTPRNSAPIHLDYRLRAYDGQWRIIDVYYDGVSQLATQRADVATLAPQPAALAAHFNEAAAALK
ncbi:MAG TPA: ABC transporter substrate-binding protein [Steroidobacteraceae bacterium]|nr:ABC transporter substrate-binding protein [Steroidobacteraceae bacterium]